MARKIKTTPFQREVLWSMAETGQCGLVSLANSLIYKFPLLSKNEIVEELRRSIGILDRAGCLYLMRKITDEAIEPPGTEKASLDPFSSIAFDSECNEWIAAKESEGEYVLQLTLGGVNWLDILAAGSTEPTPVWRADLST